MQNKTLLYRLWRIITVGSLSLAVVMVMLAPRPVAAMPPRPPRPTALPKAPSPKRTLIVLKVMLQPEALPTAWRELWTVVQWQDGMGDWHDVEGWRGNLDEEEPGIGKKVWLVEDKDLGDGPFRWLLYARPGGPLAAISDPFYLPAAPGDVLERQVVMERQ
jgi:hypothetical protein